MNKILSIILPVYNPNLEHFEKCLESIFAVLSDETELIVVDDASPDKSFMEYLSGHECTILHNETNLRAGMARQVGLDHSTAEFVTFVDQDDELIPGKFLEMVERLKTSGCTLVYWTPQAIGTGYNYKDTGIAYVDPEEKEFLHGVFFNRQGLIDNDIRFSDKLIASEDTYFLSLVNAVVQHSTDLWCSMKETFPVYNWFLWNDTTSRTPVDGQQYIVRYFDTYVDCHILSLEWARARWDNPNYYIPRTVLILFNIYSYSQFYDYTGDITPEMLSEIRKFVQWSLKFLDVDYDHLMDYCYGQAEAYFDEMQEIITHYPAFIHKKSFPDWLKMNCEFS